VNTYQALDTASTDNESTDLLSAPDLHEESPDLLGVLEQSVKETEGVRGGSAGTVSPEMAGSRE
jgi:hypothetical protein